MITLICGRIGCGKTTLARQMNARLLSVDAEMLRRYPPCLGDRHEALAAAVQAELLKQAAEAEDDVVLDWGFWKKSDRQAVRAFFAQHKKPVRFLWLDIDEAELQRRRMKRNANRPADAYFIDENLARKCDGAFEPPDDTEDIVRITD